MKTASLPKDYETYVFDLYGTLVDINTDEENMDVWEKLSLFYGYYKANYTKEELKLSYKEILIGILIGFIIMTKHNIGLLLALTAFIMNKNRIKLIKKTSIYNILA